jgi:hypothetical protein
MTCTGTNPNEKQHVSRFADHLVRRAKSLPRTLSSLFIRVSKAGPDDTISYSDANVYRSGAEIQSGLAPS